MEIQEIRNIPIREFLSRLGHAPTGEKGNVLWYSAPYRRERTPSFKVDTDRGLWFDFGTGRGGDIFCLAGEFIGSSDFKAQAKFILEAWGGRLPDFGTAVLPKGNPCKEGSREKEVFVNVRFMPLHSRPLLGYLEGRGISSGVALKNCKEVRYTSHGKRYFAIGFKNMNGGYELRDRFFKGCLPPKEVSLIGNGSDTCNLFEGFIDYLSWVELGLGCGDDYLVLNSVALLERSFALLDRYELVRCYLDRDEAGRRALETLRKRYGNKVEDCSALYKGFKDLNEYLQHRDMTVG